MIEKLVVDRFLTLPGFDQSPPSEPGTNAFPPHFVRAPGRTYNIEESVSSGPFDNRVKTSQINPGSHFDKVHRTFRWLPWVLGKVSCVRLTGADILTGTMSGCWLVIFQRNGERYAGHIGTDTSPGSANTLQARAAWRNAVTANLIMPIVAFNPVGPDLPPLHQLNVRTNENESAEFYGAYTANGKMYTVVLGIPVSGGNKRRIASVVEMRTTQDVTAF